MRARAVGKKFSAKFFVSSPLRCWNLQGAVLKVSTPTRQLSICSCLACVYIVALHVEPWFFNMLPRDVIESQACLFAHVNYVLCE